MSTTTVTTYSTRQRLLLSSAVRVLAHSGLRGLTHRAVDTEAGLPQGSCSAYMRTRLALLTGLTEYVTAYFAHDVEQLTERIEEHQGDAGYAVRETAAMLRSWLLEPELLLARVELSIEGTREPQVQRIGQDQLHQLERIAESAMVSVGHEHGLTRAKTLIAALDGVLMHALREDPADRTAFLHDSVELLMGVLVGEDPDDRP
jgi:DNA-binding transcriptional regulator YbjK